MRIGCSKSPDVVIIPTGHASFLQTAELFVFCVPEKTSDLWDRRFSGYGNLAKLILRSDRAIIRGGKRGRLFRM